jgi:mRNA interferase RelE/StbE
MKDVIYTRTALKELLKLPSDKAQLIRTGMKEVAMNPFERDTTITTLKGYPNGYRKRFGDWRVLYTVDTTIQILEVFKVGHRKDVYR